MADDILVKCQIPSTDLTLGDLGLELELEILTQASCEMFILSNKWNWNTVFKTKLGTFEQNSK